MIDTCTLVFLYSLIDMTPQDVQVAASGTSRRKVALITGITDR